MRWIMVSELNLDKVRLLVGEALAEDIGSADITTDRVIPVDMEIDAVFEVRHDGIVAGIPVIEVVFQTMDKRLKMQRKAEEGDRITAGQDIFEVSGSARSILTAERTALNFLCFLSGISTLTNKFVAKVKDYDVTILDTRKNIPTMRFLEKYAVTVGGGTNHRIGLYDQVLIKDNHLKIQQQLGPGFVHRAITASRKSQEEKIEIEIHNLVQAQEAVASGADVLLLDNMSIEAIKEVVAEFKGQIPLEVSGGVNLDNIEGIAATGIDYISIGALTHSAPALDMALEIK